MVLDHEFPPDIRVENEIEALLDVGHEVHLACYTFGNGLLKETKNERFIIHRKKISGFIYKTSVGALKFSFYFNFWRSFLTQLFKEENFEAIHIHDLPLSKVGYEFAKKYKIRFVIDLHENWPALLSIADHTQSLLGRFLSNNKQWERYEITHCHKANHIIVVVEEAKTRLAGLGIDPDKITIVSNTLNFNHFNPPEAKPEENYFTLLYAGGINKHRGLQYVIKGLRYLEKSPKPIRLFILGSGSYTKTLKELTAKNQVEHMIEFLGWKSYKDMQYYFGLADACLIPHVKNEHTDSTIPHKLFQYMYAGKPTIASNCIPIKRIIEETNCGLIYNYNSPKEFAQKTAQLINSDELYHTLLENGIISVKMKYNWDNDKKKLINIYEK